MPEFSELKPTMPGILDPGLLIDPKLTLDETKIKTLFKIGLLTSKHIYIPASFVIAHADAIKVLSDAEFQKMYTVQDVDDCSPLLISYNKNSIGIDNSIEGMISRGVYFGILTKEANKKLRQKKDKDTFYSLLDENIRLHLQNLHNKLETCETGVNQGIDMTPGNYKDRVMEVLKDNIENESKIPGYSYSEFLKLCNTFYTKIEPIPEDKFTRSLCMQILDDASFELNIDQELKTAFHQIVINAAWQLNVAKSDKVNYVVQGKPMISHLMKVFGGAVTDVKNIKYGRPTTKSYEILNNEFVISTLNNLTVDHILKIREKHEFDENMTKLLTSDEKKIDYVLNDHVAFLTNEIQDMGVHPDSNYAKAMEQTEKISRVESKYDIFDKIHSVMKSTLASNMISDGMWDFLPDLDMGATGLKLFFQTHKLLDLDIHREAKKAWYSAITIAFNP